MIADDERAGGIIRNMRSMLRKVEDRCAADRRQRRGDDDHAPGWPTTPAARRLPGRSSSATTLPTVTDRRDAVDAGDAQPRRQRRGRDGRRAGCGEPVSCGRGPPTAASTIEVRDHGPGIAPERAAAPVRAVLHDQAARDWASASRSAGRFSRRRAGASVQRMPRTAARDSWCGCRPRARRGRVRRRRWRCAATA